MKEVKKTLTILVDGKPTQVNKYGRRIYIYVGGKKTEVLLYIYFFIVF